MRISKFCPHVFLGSRFVAGLLLLNMGLCGTAWARETPSTTVPHVDLQLYDGSLKVWNQCYRPTATGGWQLEHVEGRAVVASSPEAQRSQARLKVSFGGPFAGDYWVIALDGNYQYAIVGHPQRKYLWILSRHPHISAQRYHSLLKQLVALGYKPDRLERTPALTE